MHRSLDRDSTTAVDTCAPVTVRFMQLRRAILSEQISRCCYVSNPALTPINSSAPTSITIRANLGQSMSSYPGTRRLTCPGMLEVYNQFAESLLNIMSPSMPPVHQTASQRSCPRNAHVRLGGGTTPSLSQLRPLLAMRGSRMGERLYGYRSSRVSLQSETPYSARTPQSLALHASRAREAFRY